LSALPFIAFALVFVALVCAHFVPAYRAWLGSRIPNGSDIDTGYVRVEDYFARSFRAKVSEWVKLAPYAAMPDGTRLVKKGKERLRLTNSCQYPPQSQLDDVLIVRGGFQCSAGCVFHREIFVSGDATIGVGSRLQSIAADGNLTIGDSVRITRWADSAGELAIGVNASVGSKTTAGRIIYLQDGVRIKSAFAPTVSTAPKGKAIASVTESPVLPELELPVLGSPPAMAEILAKSGVDVGRLIEQEPHCWIYDGDLRPAAPIRILTGLIVRGDCILPEGSVIEGDIKSKASLSLGARSVCRGNAIAEGDLTVGASARFCGVLHSGGTLRIHAGARGGDPAAHAAAYAADNLLLSGNVIIHGKVAAGENVIVKL
jgi:hypothetical protein